MKNKAEMAIEDIGLILCVLACVVGFVFPGFAKWVLLLFAVSAAKAWLDGQ